MARHMLRTHAWTESEILLAERVLRHDGSRRKASIVPTLQRFATRQPPEEKEAWARLTQMLESNEELVNALHSLLAL